MSKALQLDHATHGAASAEQGSPVGIAALLVSTLACHVLIGVVRTFVGSLGTARGLANDDVDRIAGISNLLSLAVCLWAPGLEHSR